MKFDALLAVADAAYPDGAILRHWNRADQRPERGPMGDTLALFIVIELFETFDPKATDEEQLREGLRVLHRAILDLDCVRTAFMQEMVRCRARRRS
jgi:hypothetical protein